MLWLGVVWTAHGIIMIAIPAWEILNTSFFDFYLILLVLFDSPLQFCLFPSIICPIAQIDNPRFSVGVIGQLLHVYRYLFDLFDFHNSPIFNSSGVGLLIILLLQNDLT